MTKIDKLVVHLHRRGLSQVAAALNLFLCNANREQKRALEQAIDEWHYTVYTDITDIRL